MKSYSIFNHFCPSCGRCFMITQIKKFCAIQIHEMLMRVKSYAISRTKIPDGKKSFTNALLSKLVLLYLKGSTSIRVILKVVRVKELKLTPLFFQNKRLLKKEIPHFQRDKRNSAAPVNKQVKSKLIIDSEICIWLRKQIRR